jgi:hypothetical protein
MLFNNSPNGTNDFLFVRFQRAESPECDLERGYLIVCAADLYGRMNQQIELLEIDRSYVGDGTEFYFILTPINPLEALPGPRVR